MREHQIVINLKREQFEEVQRLARLAGSKSAATYLRDRVLALLALQQNEISNEQATAPSTQELLEINHELTRMHRELQVFIAESLSTNTFSTDEDVEDDLDDEIYHAHRNLQQALEDDLEDYRTQGDDTAYSAPSDPYPIFQAPVQPTIKQPPPFAPHRTNSAQALPKHYAQEPEEDRNAPDSSLDVGPDYGLDSNQQYSVGRYQQSAASARPPIANPEAAEPPPWQPAQQSHLNDVSLNHSGKNATTQFQNQAQVNLPDAITPGAWSGNSSTNAGIYSNSTAESIWLTPPNQVLTPGYQNDAVNVDQNSDNFSANAYSSNPPGDTGLHQADGGKQSLHSSGQDYQSGGAAGGSPDQLGIANDELEDLAERAFAISPRLGAIDKPSKPSTPVGFRKRQAEDPLDDLIDDKIMEEAEKLRIASIEEAGPYESSVVYAFDSAETQDTSPTTQPQSDSDLTISFPQSEETQSLTNDLALQLQLQTQTAGSEFQDQGTIPDLSYAVGQSSEDSQPTATTPATTESATDEPVPQDLSGSQDPDSSPPPPAPSMEDPPPPPAPRPDSGTLTGPPPKRRRLPDDQSVDDDERISGGPPPKRRKR